MSYRKFSYKKLIRDKILPDMLEHGEKPDYRILNSQEYIEALIDKIKEESEELSTEKDKLIGEIADIQEVIDCLIKELGISKADLRSAQKTKNDKAGSFKEKIYVDTSELPIDNTWITYLENNPDRYPEIT